MTNKEAINILINTIQPPIIRNDGKSLAHLLALEAIQKAVAALEAEPIKHGKWIKMSDADGIYWACSECGENISRIADNSDIRFGLYSQLKSIDKTPYCPNCGAKMDLAEVMWNNE